MLEDQEFHCTLYFPVLTFRLKEKQQQKKIPGNKYHVIILYKFFPALHAL